MHSALAEDSSLMDSRNSFTRLQSWLKKTEQAGNARTELYFGSEQGVDLSSDNGEVVQCILGHKLPELLWKIADSFWPSSKASI